MSSETGTLQMAGHTRRTRPRGLARRQSGADRFRSVTRRPMRAHEIMRTRQVEACPLKERMLNTFRRRLGGLYGGSLGRARPDVASPKCAIRRRKARQLRAIGRRIAFTGLARMNALHRTYRSEMASPLKSTLAINPTCRPCICRSAPFSLRRTIAPAPAPSAAPAPTAP